MGVVKNKTYDSWTCLKCGKLGPYFICDCCIDQDSVRKVREFLGFDGKDVKKKVAIKSQPTTTKLPDTETHINRVEIRSESSNALYIVSQRRIERYWECSCPGWTRHPKRDCKHLKSMGLPGGCEPFELSAKKSSDGILSKYKTYEGPKGKPEDWSKAFETQSEPEPKESIGIRKVEFLEDEE